MTCDHNWLDQITYECTQCNKTHQNHVVCPDCECHDCIVMSKNRCCIICHVYEGNTHPLESYETYRFLMREVQKTPTSDLLLNHGHLAVLYAKTVKARQDAYFHNKHLKRFNDQCDGLIDHIKSITRD